MLSETEIQKIFEYDMSEANREFKMFTLQGI